MSQDRTDLLKFDWNGSYEQFSIKDQEVTLRVYPCDGDIRTFVLFANNINPEQSRLFRLAGNDAILQLPDEVLADMATPDLTRSIVGIKLDFTLDSFKSELDSVSRVIGFPQSALEELVMLHEADIRSGDSMFSSDSKDLRRASTPV